MLFTKFQEKKYVFQTIIYIIWSKINRQKNIDLCSAHPCSDTVLTPTNCARSFIELQQKLWINLNIKICLARLNIIHSSIIIFKLGSFNDSSIFFTGFKITILKKVSF